MNVESIPNIAMRWLHIFGAITAVGASLFVLVALRPAVKTLSSETQASLGAALRPRFARLIMIAVAALVVSGFYNYIVVLRPQHEGQWLYHALMIVKILLAFVVFFVASALTGKSPAFEKMRAAGSPWLAINVVLALAVVLLGAILRSLPHTTPG